MIKLLLGLDRAPSPHDAADALAVAICHVHSMPASGLRAAGAGVGGTRAGRAARDAPPGATSPEPRVTSPESPVPRSKPSTTRALTSWRQYRPPAG
jgi:hypothetical protein